MLVFRKILQKYYMNDLICHSQQVPCHLLICNKFDRHLETTFINCPCVKSVQTRRYSWSAFSCIRTEYGDLRSSQHLQTTFSCGFHFTSGDTLNHFSRKITFTTRFIANRRWGICIAPSN